MYITPELLARIKRKEPHEHIHVIVKVSQAGRECATKLVEKPHHTIRHQIRLINAFSLALPAGEVERLAEEPWVERIEMDRKVYATLDTSVPLIGVPKIWEEGYTGKGINIAIIDTGVDKSHPDLFPRVVATKDFTLEGFRDFNGHGTHVAGIAAGSGASSKRRYRGVAPEANILAAKVLKGDGTGRMSDVMAGIEWVLEMGAHIINLSLGSEGPCEGTDALSETCDAAVGQGVIICAAAGNDGPKKYTIGSPGCAKNVITVGASTDRDKVARFSSRGPTADERLKPDVVAPGVDIISCRADEVLMGKPVNDHYTSATGTSMATPHVAGLCALLLQAKPVASPLLIKEAFIHTAKDLGVNQYAQGVGRIVAEDALRYVETHENPPEAPELGPTKPGCLATFWEIVHLVKKRLKGN
ncbi:MAG: S8 family peptidase [Actinomycetota bacterium]